MSVSDNEAFYWWKISLNQMSSFEDYLPPTYKLTNITSHKNYYRKIQLPIRAPGVMI